MLFIAGTRITVIGEEKIRTNLYYLSAITEAILIFFLLIPGVKGLTGYIAKKEMLRYPLLRDWMKRLYCLFLDRENPKEGLKTILQAIDYIKNGISICIFPEGTRNTGEELSLLPFHSGSFKIAEKTNCPIVPISMNNTISIFESHLPKVRKAHVILEYGDPIYPGDLDKDARRRLAPYCQNIIQETINRNQALL